MDVFSGCTTLPRDVDNLPQFPAQPEKPESVLEGENTVNL